MVRPMDSHNVIMAQLYLFVKLKVYSPKCCTITIGNYLKALMAPLFQMALCDSNRIVGRVLPRCYPERLFVRGLVDNLLKSLARPTGFEPVASAFGGQVNAKHTSRLR